MDALFEFFKVHNRSRYDIVNFLIIVIIGTIALVHL